MLWSLWAINHIQDHASWNGKNRSLVILQILQNSQARCQQNLYWIPGLQLLVIALWPLVFLKMTCTHLSFCTFAQHQFKFLHWIHAKAPEVYDCVQACSQPRRNSCKQQKSRIHVSTSRERLYKELRNFIPIFSCLAYLWRPHMHLDLAFVDSRYEYKSIDSVREKWEPASKW